MSKTISAGIGIRRQVRRYLMAQGIDFTEDKGWVDSLFRLDCDDVTYARIIDTLKNTYNN